MPIETRLSAEGKKETLTTGNIFLSGKVTAQDRMFFTERLSLLLSTGNSLQPSLSSLQKQTEKPRVRAIINDLSEKVLGGQPFSQALALHPEMFPVTYVNLIRASEQGGFMGEVLAKLLDMDEKRERVQATLVSSMTYPVFLVLFSTAVVLFILVVVFPKFGVLFSSIRDQLPLSTIALMEMSEQLTRNWLPLTGGSLLMVVGAQRGLSSPRGAAGVDRFKLKFPFVREIHVQLYLLQSLRVLSLSLANGVPLLDSLQSCNEVVKNRSFQRFMGEVEKKVTEGRGVAAAFEESELIPPMVGQMMRTGEETGNLAEVAERIADFYEREMGKKLTLISKIAEPVMLLVMGAVVGGIVASLILPIFKLTRAVH